MAVTRLVINKHGMFCLIDSYRITELFTLGNHVITGVLLSLHVRSVSHQYLL